VLQAEDAPLAAARNDPAVQHGGDAQRLQITFRVAGRPGIRERLAGVHVTRILQRIEFCLKLFFRKDVTPGVSAGRELIEIAAFEVCSRLVIEPNRHPSNIQSMGNRFRRLMDELIDVAGSEMFG